MKRRRLLAALIVLLCAASLLSGVLLILHSEQHACHVATCPVCTVLARSIENFLYASVLLTGFQLLRSLGLFRLIAPQEDRFVPEWTLVRRKVKLLD